MPDGDILAWLRQQAYDRRGAWAEEMIDMRALGSTRAERLRRIVVDEAAHNAAASAG